MRREFARLLVPAAVPLLVVVSALAFERSFFTATNLHNVTRQAAFLTVVALGQLIVIIGRGLDLSVGAVITTTLLLVVEIAGQPGGSATLALLVVVVVGLLIGILNGAMVAFRKVPAILATLGTLVLVEGVSVWVTQGRSRGRVPELIKPLGVGKLGPVPVPVVVALIATLACWVLIHRSTWGHKLYAIGSNPEASHLSGISARTLQASTYVLSSLLAVLAGLMLSGYVGFYDRTLGVGYDLNSIAAVVLGGASLLGGRGNVGGTVAAALGLVALDNLLLILGVDVSVKLIGKAAVLFLAVLSAGWFASSSSRSRPAGKRETAIAPTKKGTEQ